MSTKKQILGISLLTDEALFTFKFYTTAYQKRQLERLIFDFMFIIVGIWKSRFKIFNLIIPGTKRDVARK